MMTDPIADMLTRIRNAQVVGKPTVAIPLSRFKRSIAELLVREGWLERMETRPVADTRKRSVSSPREEREEMVLTLRYRERGVPYITSIRRVSRPGRRVYVTRGAVPRVKRGAGLAVLSTPKGLLTNAEARKVGIGGEVICEVY